MWTLTFKALLSAVLIVAIAELGKRSSFWAAALASLPLTSLLLFVLLPWLLRSGWGFWPALLLSCVATALAYALMVWLLPRLGIML